MCMRASLSVLYISLLAASANAQPQTILHVKDHPTGADDSTPSTSQRGGCEPTPQAQLLPFGAVEPVAFGNSVSIDGDVALVSAHFADVAYVFRFDGAAWSEEQVLLAWDGAPSFGHSVAVSGDAVIVGGTGIKGYVFRFDGSQWIPEQIIEVEQAQQEGNGKTEQLSPPSLVALSDNVAVLGSYWSGAHVFRFDGSTWFYQQELVADESYPGDRFGRSVATTGDIVVVGAHYGTGSAYVFRFLDGLWVEEQRLAASDGANLDYFGATLSVSNDVVLVGAELDDDMGFNSGSAYIYRLEGGIWNEEQKLTASDGSAYDLFGWTVSVDGDVVVVGAPYHDGEVSNTGSVYAYRFDGTTWTEQASAQSAVE